LFELVLRIGFSLFVVLGLMWALARVVRRPLGVGRAHGQLAVLNRQQLTRNAAVTVVKVADRAMILGVTEQQVSFLGEADIAAFEHHPEHRASASDELPQHVRQNPAVLVVAQLLGRIDARQHLEGLRCAVRTACRHAQRRPRTEGIVQTRNVEPLEAGEAERVARLAVRELERQHAHADEVRPVNALERLGDRRADA